MLEQDTYFDSIKERDIDLLLIEELHIEPSFQQFIFESLIPQQKSVSFIGAWHPVSTHNGESDVIVIFSDENGKIVALLIENKINASAQYRQGERYIERSKEGTKNGI
ncbi:hypothetical protein F9L16_05315 [Agarivorans sp. B2Z047]|uniref:hypothetical protein n=1 Tax=Agarivorans sp. B2Z047 TaxID=2652721 RepID=UPI00128B678A|nr:hypothetical protein [Agarivorans sp. B2Z047]MPW28420.1 hypothetical protein [Agarivorans sp. B2Z047]UQN43760.1 hypothetical protein LQZ07_04625 [Agarivorans sp. B2Z047]